MSHVAGPPGFILPFAAAHLRLCIAATTPAPGDGTTDPHWAQVWPAGLALAKALLDRRFAPPAGDALEIGCGTGLASIALALAGGRVCASDRAPEALDLVRRNAADNGVDAQVETLVLDWNTTPPRRWPLILGADVLYQTDAPRAVARFLRAALDEGGTALISDPDRPSARHFHLMAQEAGLTVEMRTLPVPFVDTHGPVTALCQPQRTLTVTLFVLRPRCRT